MAVHKAIIVAVPVILVILFMPARLGSALVALLLAVSAFGAHIRAHNATPVLPWAVSRVLLIIYILPRRIPLKSPKTAKSVGDFAEKLCKM
jgi:thiol:disulfide interchange protein